MLPRKRGADRAYCLHYLIPAHFAGGVCDAGGRSNGGGAGCTRDRCSSTSLGRGAPAAPATELGATAAHFHKTIALAQRGIVVTSRYLVRDGRDTGVHGSGPAAWSPVRPPITGRAASHLRLMVRALSARVPSLFWYAPVDGAVGPGARRRARACAQHLRRTIVH